MEPPICFVNASTNRVRLYLRNITTGHFSLTPGQTMDRIKDFLVKDPASKWLVHNVLFLHMDFAGIENVKSKLEYFGLINLQWKPISLDFYVESVVHCQLHEHFLQMLVQCMDTEIFIKLLVGVSERICMYPERLMKEEWILYLSILPRLGLKTLEATGLLLRCLCHLPKDQISALDKVEILVRVAGLWSLNRDDYEGTTDIADSIRDLMFDPMLNNISTVLSAKFFADMFSKSVTIPQDLMVDVAFLELLCDSLFSLEFDMEDQDTIVLMRCGQPVRISKQKALHLAYIGDCAQLSGVLLQRTAVQGTNEYARKIISGTAHLRSFRTPSDEEDLATKVMTFTTFCKLLISSSKKYREHQQASWYERFCSYSEAFTTPEGCKLAEEMVAPNVGRVVGLRMIGRIMNLTMNDQLKTIVLATIFNARSWAFQLNERQLDPKVMGLVFPNGRLNSNLEKEDFRSELGNFLVSLGSEGSYVKKTLQLTPEYVKRLWSLAFQNAIVVTRELLIRVVQVPHMRQDVIETLTPFWSLIPPEDANADPNSVRMSSNLFEHTIESVLSWNLHDQMKNSTKKFLELIPTIITSGPITPGSFQELLTEHVRRLIVDNAPQKLLRLLEIQQAFAVWLSSLPSEETKLLIQRLSSLVEGIKQSTYISGPDNHTVRDKAAEILLSLGNSLEMPKQERNDDPHCLNGLSFMELVALYCRSSHWCDIVRSHVTAPTYETTFGQEFSAKNVGDLVFNSSSLEWKNMFEILFQATRAHQPRRTLTSFLSVVGNVLLLQVPTKPTSVDQIASKGSKELKSPDVHFLQFGRSVVKVLTTEESFELSSNAEEQLKLVKVLVTVSRRFPDGQQYLAARQLALLSLLDLVSWIVNVNGNEKMKRKLRVATLVLCKMDLGKLAPIVQKIASLLKVENRKVNSIWNSLWS